jgi:hypothetical protein
LNPVCACNAEQCAASPDPWAEIDLQFSGDEASGTNGRFPVTLHRVQ